MFWAGSRKKQLVYKYFFLLGRIYRHLKSLKKKKQKKTQIDLGNQFSQSDTQGNFFQYVQRAVGDWPLFFHIGTKLSLFSKWVRLWRCQKVCLDESKPKIWRLVNFKVKTSMTNNHLYCREICTTMNHVGVVLN